MSKHNNCNGCVTNHVPVVEECEFYIDNINGDCPCSKCIVKTMCDEWCDPFLEWTWKMREDYMENARRLYSEEEIK